MLTARIDSVVIKAELLRAPVGLIRALGGGWNRDQISADEEIQPFGTFQYWTSRRLPAESTSTRAITGSTMISPSPQFSDRRCQTCMWEVVRDRCKIFHSLKRYVYNYLDTTTDPYELSLTELQPLSLWKSAAFRKRSCTLRHGILFAHGMPHVFIR